MKGRRYLMINWAKFLMKIIILTTLTPHHIYFVKKVSEYFGIHTTILEKESLVPPFNTYHSFEKEREQYERKRIIAGRKTLLC